MTHPPRKYGPPNDRWEDVPRTETAAIIIIVALGLLVWGLVIYELFRWLLG